MFQKPRSDVWRIVKRGDVSLLVVYGLIKQRIGGLNQDINTGDREERQSKVIPRRLNQQDEVSKDNDLEPVFWPRT